MRGLQSPNATRQHGQNPIADPSAELAVAGCVERDVDCGECGELLHGLNNALASVLLNAQVMALKLPSYSRGKRYLHEIERNAQRGGELVKRLLERSHARCDKSACGRRADCEAPTGTGFDDAEAMRQCDALTKSTEPRPTS